VSKLFISDATLLYFF